MDVIDLSSRLDEARSWRKLELSLARSVAEGSKGTAAEPYLCRSWTLMMYAHCDQMLKDVAMAYLDYLLKNPREDYDYHSVWLAFFGKEAVLHAGDERYSIWSDRSLPAREQIVRNLQQKEVFGSNSFKYKSLRFFADWVLQCKLDHQSYKGFCDTLKIKRDRIAHGEREFVERIEDCVDWHIPALRLIDDVCDRTLNLTDRH